jgi:hypothetical protein
LRKCTDKTLERCAGVTTDISNEWDAGHKNTIPRPNNALAANACGTEWMPAIATEPKAERTRLDNNARREPTRSTSHPAAGPAARLTTATVATMSPAVSTEIRRTSRR